MKKLMTNILLAAAISLAFKWRYKLLNAILGNDSIRKMSVRAAMNIPGVKERLIQGAFRK
ncbi:hypothetical protein [Siminovitchia sp. 179-K 8D1 HS]|uniref:hypothetical protein n=1 Tax=Siminovitchia sp. 179-K 8D1 HS TaxID=3142385 RepID=UPI0039A15801